MFRPESWALAFCSSFIYPHSEFPFLFSIFGTFFILFLGSLTTHLLDRGSHVQWIGPGTPRLRYCGHIDGRSNFNSFFQIIVAWRSGMLRCRCQKLFPGLVQVERLKVGLYGDKVCFGKSMKLSLQLSIGLMWSCGRIGRHSYALCNCASTLYSTELVKAVCWLRFNKGWAELTQEATAVWFTMANSTSFPSYRCRGDVLFDGPVLFLSFVDDLIENYSTCANI